MYSIQSLFENIAKNGNSSNLLETMTAFWVLNSHQTIADLLAKRKQPSQDHLSLRAQHHSYAEMCYLKKISHTRYDSLPLWVVMGDLAFQQVDTLYRLDNIDRYCRFSTAVISLYPNQTDRFSNKFSNFLTRFRWLKISTVWVVKEQ